MKYKILLLVLFFMSCNDQYHDKNGNLKVAAVKSDTAYQLDGQFMESNVFGDVPAGSHVIGVGDNSKTEKTKWQYVYITIGETSNIAVIKKVGKISLVLNNKDTINYFSVDYDDISPSLYALCRDHVAQTSPTTREPVGVTSDGQYLFLSEHILRDTVQHIHDTIYKTKIVHDTIFWMNPIPDDGFQFQEEMPVLQDSFIHVNIFKWLDSATILSTGTIQKMDTSIRIYYY